MSFTLPDLAYDYDALEPHIDAKTMEIHHTLHHQTYINKANVALEGSHYSEQDAETLLRTISSMPESLQKAVQEHVGGHYNHSLFWQVMSPNGGGEPSEELNTAIVDTFGSFDAFKKQFTNAAVSRFGSGWAWLCVDENNLLLVESSLNQDSPLMHNHTPILGLDVWEHAYYLKYQNRRPDYIAAFYEVINWPEVERRYLAALK
ncbi:MAG: superoxide dismutase [Mn] [Pseudoalteromonas sp.]|uniref:superoxide dismutase n=1 Tax=unclassified Pseudoalteromonas TaxID=194690 RepID=UPI000C95404D|nr:MULTISPECIES: superoxide dismutase [unclassified Pseudoalteromonas]MAD04433.1 superoxide dismutase [Mn] [Pseudoalteromonas sp.]NIZ07147.1 superoxide dismutase [Pseudoalteromonas sp. HF66]|tara:strand:+ start:15314 stop:15925 length:612 start_codon:yes stop_codon:yes gene_type:complete